MLEYLRTLFSNVWNNQSGRGPTRLCIVFLHGLGGNKHSLADLGNDCAKRIPRAEIGLLQGPINFGTASVPSFGWFVPPGDRHRALDDPQRKKPQGLAESLKYIHDQLRELAATGISSDNVHLIGHSQGAAAAIACGLSFERKLGSVSTIAGYLALDDEMIPINNGTEFHLHHSLHDKNVAVAWSDYAKRYIESVGCKCDVRRWDIPNDAHGIHGSQVDAIFHSIQTQAKRCVEPKRWVD